MSGWHLFQVYMDYWLMPFYRWPDAPIVGFLVGTFVLASACVILGDLTFNLVVRADRKKITSTTAETVRLNNLSIEALQAGEGESYRACNKLANEAFGRMFFLQVALSTASLWPIPFALAWMQYRFVEVEFPLPFISASMGYIGPFLMIYILARIGFGRIRPKLPFFRGAKNIFMGLQTEAGRMKSWRSVFKAPEKAKQGGSSD